MASKGRLLLTGGSGFIGRNLLESSTFSGYDVLAPRHHDLDLGDEDGVRAFIRAEGVDYVVHSAVKPGHRNAKDSSQLLLTNLRMFFNLARNMDVVKKMVVIGSGAIYDNRYYGPKRTEESYIDHVPADDHGFAKYAIEKYIETHERIVDLRVFGIYGKYEDYQIRFISNMICKALAGLPLTIKQDRKFDYLYVDDLGPVIVRALEDSPPWSTLNVTPNESESLVGIARTVLEVVGRPDLPIRISLPGNGLEYSGDNSRLHSWFPNLTITPLKIGIQNLVSWYRSQWDTIDVARLEVDP